MKFKDDAVMEDSGLIASVTTSVEPTIDISSLKLDASLRPGRRSSLLDQLAVENARELSPIRTSSTESSATTNTARETISRAPHVRERGAPRRARSALGPSRSDSTSARGGPPKKAGSTHEDQVGLDDETQAALAFIRGPNSTTPVPRPARPARRPNSTTPPRQRIYSTPVVPIALSPGA